MLENVGCLQSNSGSTSTTRRRNRRNNTDSKRFSEEQIRSMKAMFEKESWLEPEAKIRLAKELGLHPQQVAIWFQNRRARRKSKQLERDYCLLKADYDALASKFESINKEKQMLLMQLQEITDMGRNPNDESKTSPLCMDGNITDGDSDNGEYNTYEPQKNNPQVSFEESDFRMPIYSEEAYLMSAMDPSSPILTNQCGSTSQWWKLWA